MESILREKIVDRIIKDGDIPFSVFIKMALFDKEYGYYNSSRVFGDQGDFVTSPITSSLFGKSLANEFVNLSKLIDIGGGDASLAISIITQLEEKECLPKEYIIIESSLNLIELQKKAIKDYFKTIPSYIVWHNNLDQFSVRHGMIIANEFFDVIPTERFKYNNKSFSKLFITYSDNSLEYKWKKDAEISAFFKEACNKHDINLHQGYESEINLNYDYWMEKISSCISKGIVILIDYGYNAREYYLDKGTLICIKNHTTNFNPLQDIGNQDISSFVNFSHISNISKKYGLETKGYLSQACLLINLGILEICNDKKINNNNPDLNNLKNILLPNTMGELFKALIISKEVNQELLSTREFNQLEKL